MSARSIVQKIALLVSVVRSHTMIIDHLQWLALTDARRCRLSACASTIMEHLAVPLPKFSRMCPLPPDHLPTSCLMASYTTSCRRGDCRASLEGYCIMSAVVLTIVMTNASD